MTHLLKFQRKKEREIEIERFTFLMSIGKENNKNVMEYIHTYIKYMMKAAISNLNKCFYLVGHHNLKKKKIDENIKIKNF